MYIYTHMCVCMCVWNMRMHTEIIRGIVISFTHWCRHSDIVALIYYFIPLTWEEGFYSSQYLTCSLPLKVSQFGRHEYRISFTSDWPVLTATKCVLSYVAADSIMGQNPVTNEHHISWSISDDASSAPGATTAGLAR